MSKLLSNWWPLKLVNKRPMVFKFPHRKHRKLWTSADRIRRPDLYEGGLILPYQNRSGTPLSSYPSWCRRTVDLPTICSCDALVNLVYLEAVLASLTLVMQVARCHFVRWPPHILAGFATSLYLKALVLAVIVLLAHVSLFITRSIM